MLLSRAKLVRNAKTAFEHKSGGSSSSSAGGVGGGDKKPKLEDFLERRDFMGAMTLLEFQRQTGEPAETIMPWLGYAAFHLGDFQKALKTYREILEEPRADPVNHLYAACCLFFLGMYKEALEECDKGPRTRLQTRIRYHLAHHLGEEGTLMELHHTLTDTVVDQLSVAAIHYHRNHYQDASDIYKKLLIEYRDQDYLALQVYMALCYYKLDYYDVSLDILGSYLEKHPDSAIALNLKACNQFKLFDGQTAESELKGIIEVLSNASQNFDNDLVNHNLVVFREGENALQVLPQLVDVVPEARLNLVVSHLRNGEINEAYELVRNLEPSTPQEYVLMAVVYTSYAQLPDTPEQVEVEHLETAKKFYQLVGSSASECDTIPGRQCMASSFWLNDQMEDVLVYLNSVKVYSYNDPVFNYNYGVALASVGKYKEAEESLLLVTNERLASEFMFISWLARCFIFNGKPRDAWELYLKMDHGADTFELVRLIANDCYRVGSFFFACKAFDVLERLDAGNPEYWDGKLGAACGVLQLCCAGQAGKDQLRDVIDMLRANSGNPQVQHVVRVMQTWLQENAQYGRR